MTYVYPAIFTQLENGGYAIRFPDLPGTNSEGKNMSDALYMARDALASWIDYLIDEKSPIPEASIPYTEKVGPGEIITLIDANMDAYRRRKNSKAVKKTLTIPSWLNEEAEAANINFSSVLQDSLKERLNLQDR